MAWQAAVPTTGSAIACDHLVTPRATLISAIAYILSH